VLLLANAGLPGTLGFIGEAGLVWGCFSYHPFCALMLFCPMMLMAIRSFLLYVQLCWGNLPSFFGPLYVGKARGHSAAVKPSHRIFLGRSWDIFMEGEGTASFGLAFLGVGLGLWPGFFLEMLEEGAKTAALRLQLAGVGTMPGAAETCGEALLLAVAGRFAYGLCSARRPISVIFSFLGFVLALLLPFFSLDAAYIGGVHLLLYPGAILIFFVFATLTADQGTHWQGYGLSQKAPSTLFGLGILGGFTLFF